jgi:hypothetical protein
MFREAALMESLVTLFPATASGALNLLLLFLPVLLIALCPRARWWSRLLWASATQLGWVFVGLYAGLRLWIYGEPALASAESLQLLQEHPLAEAIGWWSFAFPWMVYLVFRATHLPLAGGPAKA